MAKLTIRWDDGRVTDVLDDGFKPANSACVEAEYRFDDLSDGLMVVVRKQEPQSAVDDYEAECDERGDPCFLKRVCFYQVLDKDDLDHVLSVHKDGQQMLARVAGELVSLSKANALAQTYLPNPESMAALLLVDELAGALSIAMAKESEGAIPDQSALAEAIGVSEGLLDIARELAESFEDGEGDQGPAEAPSFEAVDGSIQGSSPDPSQGDLGFEPLEGFGDDFD